MKNIDAVIMVSLPERGDRRKKSLAALHSHNIVPRIWYATKRENGREGLLETMSLLLGFLSYQKYNNVLIFEDDVKLVCPDFGAMMEKCVSQLPADYDLFYPGCNLHGEFTKYSENLIAAKGMYATQSVLYSMGAIQKILPLLKDAKAYDIALVEGVQNGGKSFCSYPLLTSQETGHSDIENKKVNYAKFIENRYAERTKDLR